MAYDERLADRIRRAFGPRPDVTERKMFGGIAFLLDGKMVVGIVGDDLMVRVGADAHAAALAEPHARPMDFTGRPSRGMVYVAPAGVKTAPALSRWLRRAADFVATLPPGPRPRSRPPRFPR